ncbi:hypothetical protein [Paracoccus thiocyanatus]|uniref:hypothetical protein n=1 Tax=Paracoccus thiocyanatus TaxID=34006 RepID=UPI0011C04ACC|nr:hypothetical protein [Paracoccus thiocyanatus]
MAISRATGRWSAGRAKVKRKSGPAFSLLDLVNKLELGAPDGWPRPMHLDCGLLPCSISDI